MVLNDNTFTFHPPSHPLITPLTFPPHPPPAPARTPLKRPLPLHDTAHTGSRKKRRLRLNLITSRLSRPFSTPATHAVDKGRSKIAVWAKSKRLCAGMLRKEAILNRVRRSLGKGLAVGIWRRDSLIEDGRPGGGEGILRPGVTLLRREMESRVLEVCSQDPSPLGLSNYDAFDEEDVWVEVGGDDGEEGDQYWPHPDLGLPSLPQQNQQQPLLVAEERPQPKERMRYSDLNPLDPPTNSPDFVDGDADTIRSPNSEWLESLFKASDTPASLSCMGKSLPGCKRDALTEIKWEKERQRRLLDARFE